MASHDSAIKAHRQNLVKREANRELAPACAARSAPSAARSTPAIPAKVKDALRDTISLVDKMAGKRSSTATPRRATSRAWRSGSRSARQRLR